MARCDGVIIKQSDFGEGHRMLWIFTDKFGIIKAVAHGAQRAKSKSGAATQFLAFCSFDFYESGEIWTINSAAAKDTFWPIQENIEKLALCTYLADITFYSLEMSNPDIPVLRLLLNTLYGCAYKKIPCSMIKTIYELKLMYMAGFMPLPDCCQSCGAAGGKMYLDTLSGGIFCENCRAASYVPLDEDMYKCIYCIIHCDMKKMFSVSYPEEAMAALSAPIEKYITHNLGKNIKSLDYYKIIRS